MKNKSIVLLVSLWMCMSLKAGWMVDPTYDFSFKALFGASGQICQNISPKNRLIGLLNSILNPMFRITIKNLCYLSDERDPFEEKYLISGIKVRCLFEFEYKRGTFLTDLEIYNVKTKDDIKRRKISVFDAGVACGEKPKRMVITFVDDVLTGYENDAVFFLQTHVKKYIGNDLGIKNGSPAIDRPLEIFVQLPLLKNALPQCLFAQNEWMKLLASRQKAFGNCKYVESGSCPVKSSDFQNVLVRNSIKVLKSLNDELFKYHEAILKANKAIQMQDNLNIELKNQREDYKKILRKAKKSLEKKNEKLARQHEILTFLKDKIRNKEYKDLRKISQHLKGFKKQKSVKQHQKTSKNQTTKLRGLSFDKVSKVVWSE